MAKYEISTKRLAISKANAQMVAVVGVASFVTVFCLIATNAVWQQNRYQAKVIDAKEHANNQLRDNIEAYKKLAQSYAKFDSKSPNILAGNRDGSGGRDGHNATIILDALPSSYDFPALTSSIEKALKDQHLGISSISGTDDQVNQQNNSTSATPTTVEMPFSVTIDKTSYQGVQTAINTFQRSIRPVQIDKLTITGGADNMTVTLDAHTYFQPGKSLQVKTKEISSKGGKK